MKLRLMALAIASLCFTGCDKDDDDDNSGEINSTDRDFAMRASMSSFAEVGSGQLATTRATEAGVAEFGSMMVTEHTEALQDLRDITDNLGLYTPDSLDAAHVTLMQQLNDAVAGREFDSIYIHSQVADHQAAIQLFQNLVTNGNNAQLRNYAATMLPRLNLHFTRVDSISNHY